MLFSTSDKIKIGLVLMITPILVGLSWFYSQDAVVSLGVYLLVGLIGIPFVLDIVVGQNIYEVLKYKSLLSSDSRSKTFLPLLIAAFGLTVGLAVVGVYFSLIPNFNLIVALGPYFYKYVWINYIYAAVVLVLLYFIIQIEMKLYYGVISTLLPDNVLGYLGIVLFQTSHWIGFAKVFFNHHEYFPCVFLGVMAIFYLILYIVKEQDNYRASTTIYQICAIVCYLLLVIYGILYKRSIFKKGVRFNLNNSNNVWNKII